MHGDAPNVDGRSLAEVAAAVVETPGQEVVVPIETPLKATGGLAILRGNLAPDGCVVKLAGHERLFHSGPARVFDSEEECFAAVKARSDRAGRRRRDPLRRAGRRPGDARDAARHRRARRRRARRRGRADHRRPLLRRDARPDGRPRRARGRARRADRRACATATRSSSTSRRASCALLLSDDEIAARLAARRRAAAALHEGRARPLRRRRLLGLRRSRPDGDALSFCIVRPRRSRARPAPHRERLREPAL